MTHTTNATMNDTQRAATMSNRELAAAANLNRYMAGDIEAQRAFNGDAATDAAVAAATAWAEAVAAEVAARAARAAR